MLYYGILLALAAGIFITVQGAINSMAGSTVGVFPTILIPVWVQAVLYTVALLISGEFMRQLSGVKEQPTIVFWLFLSALLGAGIMLTITLSFMKIGPLLALSLMVFSQLAISMVIEHYGLFGATVAPMSLMRLAGLGAILFGVFLFSK